MSWIWLSVATRSRTDLHTAIPTTIRTAIPIVIRSSHRTSRIVGTADPIASAQVARTTRDGAGTDNGPNVMSMLAMRIR